MINAIVLGLIIAFFASFAIGLSSVSLYVWLGERADARAKARHGPALQPVNDSRIAA